MINAESFSGDAIALENIYNLCHAILMDENVIFKSTAFGHGVSEADIRYAFDHYLFDGTVAGEEHKHLLIGLDRNGNPLEILYNVLDENAVNVFHAMKCRKKWLSFANL
jgi:hypothetical protein